MGIVQLNMFDGKVCRTCGEWKPLTAYYSNGAKGADCKECEKDRKRMQYAADPEAACERNRELRRNNPDRVKVWKQAYWQRHGEEVKVRARQKRRENPERFREHDRNKWSKNRERMQALSRQRYARNREKNRERNSKYAEQHRAELRQYAREYYKKNRVYWKEKNHQRKALLKGSGGKYTLAEWQLLCDWFGNTCLACGEKTFLTVDHVVPITKGGPNTIDNLQPLCNPCNNRKKTKTTDYRPRECLIAFMERLRCGH